MHRGLDGERCTIVTGGLRKIAVTCRESATSCATLAGSGAIAKLLDGFKSILISTDPQHSGKILNNEIMKKKKNYDGSN